MSVFQRAHMPSLDGAAEWLNSEPLGPAELRGHVVLVNVTAGTLRCDAPFLPVASAAWEAA